MRFVNSLTMRIQHFDISNDKNTLEIVIDNILEREHEVLDAVISQTEQESQTQLDNSNWIYVTSRDQIPNDKFGQIFGKIKEPEKTSGDYMIMSLPYKLGEKVVIRLLELGAKISQDSPGQLMPVGELGLTSQSGYRGYVPVFSK